MADTNVVGTGQIRTTAGQFKASGGVVYSLSYSDTAAGVVLIRDGGSGGTIKAALRLGAAGTTHLGFPKGIVFSTDIYADLSTVTAPHVGASYE